MRATERMRKARSARRSAAEKEALKPKNRVDCQERLRILYQEVPKRYLPLIDRLAEGSRTAAIKLHCLQCVGYESKEVTNCTATQCPIWPVRPYQPKLSESEGYATEDQAANETPKRKEGVE